MAKLNHIGSSLRVLCKVPTGTIVVKLIVTLQKKPLGFLKYAHWVYWWVLFKSDHNVPANLFLIKFLGTFQKNSACTQWVNCGQIASELTMYPQCTPRVKPSLPPVAGEPSKESSHSSGSGNDGGSPAYVEWGCK